MTGNRIFFLAIAITMCLILPMACIAAQPPYPLPGAKISATGSNGSGSASSDSNGNFTISQGLGAGSYSVSISPPHGYVNASRTANINQGEVTDLGDIYLNASGVIKGFVRDPDGNPLPSVIVILNDDKDNTVDYTASSTDGSFLFDRNIVNGTYSVQTVIFSISGDIIQWFQMMLQMMMQMFPGYPGLSGFALPPYIQNLTQMSIPYASNFLRVQGVQGQTISGLVLQLLPTGTISGMVTNAADNGVANVTLLVQLANASTSGLVTGYGGTATTDSTGIYSIGSNLPTGVYNVSMFSFGAFGMPAGYVANITNIRTVNVTAGSTATANFRLNNSGVISGTVRQNGNPVSGITVYASAVGGFSLPVTTGSDGKYRINTGLDTGQYMVIANNEYSTMQTVNVTAGEETPGVDFNLTSVVAFVSGKVANSTGGALISATVNGANGTVSATAYAGFDGNYILKFTLPENMTSLQVNVTASLTGYAPSSQVATINALQTTSPVDFTLLPLTGGTLKGRIVTGVAHMQSSALTISPSGSSVAVNSPLTLSGAISPATRSGTVEIRQSINGSGFTTLASVNLTAGAYSYTFSPSAPGTYRFYASWPGDSDYSPADSLQTSVSVTLAQPVGTDYTWYIVGGVIVIAAIALIYFLRPKAKPSK